MGDLQYLKGIFSGAYTSRMSLHLIKHYLREDPNGYPVYTSENTLTLMASGLKWFSFDIMPDDFDILISPYNGKEMMRFPINIPHNGYRFTNFEGQSIARYEDYTLTIEMLPEGPTARKVTYQFHEVYQKSKQIHFEYFNGTTSWQMTYDKIVF